MLGDSFQYKLRKYVALDQFIFNWLLIFCVDSVVQLVSLIKDRTTILIHLITYSELIGQQVSRTIRNGNLNYLIVYNTP